MILTDFKDFPRCGRLLGIDWGAVRIGLAVSSPDLDFVFPRGIVRGDNNKEQIKKLIESENITGIVLGLPLYLDGTDSNTTRKVREFGENLAKETTVPIIFIEENLTSVEASERVKNKKEDLDSESAAIILENAIAMIKREQNV
jgi:putative Holliday junction resolvase